MDSTIVPIDKPAAIDSKQRQVDQSKAGEQPARGSGNALASQTPEYADTTVQALVESSLEKNGDEIVFGGRSIKFALDQETKRVIVRVTDENSGEVVRQIPPEDYLRLISSFREMFGVLFDEIV